MIVWQDQTDNLGYITTLYEFTQTTVSLPIVNGHTLGHATPGESGEIFYITFGYYNDEDDQSAVTVYLYKAQTDGTTILRESLLADIDGLQVWKFDKHCHLVYISSKATLGLHFARRTQE